MNAVLLAVGAVGFGSFEFTGGGTLINLVAATTNALNGALLARRPDHRWPVNPRASTVTTTDAPFSAARSPANPPGNYACSA